MEDCIDGVIPTCSAIPIACFDLIFSCGGL
jgi:hypothetical protein